MSTINVLNKLKGVGGGNNALKLRSLSFSAETNLKYAWYLGNGLELAIGHKSTFPTKHVHGRFPDNNNGPGLSP